MEKLLHLDRRWIFLLLIVAILIAIFFPRFFRFPIAASKVVENVWRPIEELPARSPVLVALDFDPASAAELEPMARAGMRQIFRKNLRMIVMTHWPTGTQMSSEMLAETAAEFDDLDVEVLAPKTVGKAGRGIVNVGRRRGFEGLPWSDDLHEALREAKEGAEVTIHHPSPKGDIPDVLKVHRRTPTLEYGKDYVFLGTKAGEYVLVIAMGESMATAFPTDSTGKTLRSLPVMAGVESLKDVKYLLEIAAGSSADWWVIYGSQRYGFKMGVGCTAVMAPDEYPYLAAGMITGLAGGIKGAWEYEKLVETRGSAYDAVPAQTVAHCVVIALILFCNVAYVVAGRGKAAQP